MDVVHSKDYVEGTIFRRFTLTGSFDHPIEIFIGDGTIEGTGKKKYFLLSIEKMALRR